MTPGSGSLHASGCLGSLMLQRVLRSGGIGTASLVCLVCLCGSTAGGQEVVKRCPSVEVYSVEVTPETLARQKKSPRIEITEEEESNAARDRISIVAYGPVLGSMDSSKVDVGFTCTGDGVAVNARITRSANFTGGVLQNVIWHPKINMVVRILRGEPTLEVTWRLFLTNGVESMQAQTPPYPVQKYPIRAVRRIRGR